MKGPECSLEYSVRVQMLLICQQLLSDGTAKIQQVADSKELHLQLNTEHEVAEQKRCD